MRTFFVYMLFCFDGSFYVGITNNVQRRLFEHNHGLNPTSYTFSRRPVRLVYSTEFETAIDAIDWEKRVKRWSHRKKRSLITGDWDAIRRFAKSPNRN